MKKIDAFVLILLIIGGINWGLWGIFDLNLVDYVFGPGWIEKLIFFLIGISGIYALVTWKSARARWQKK